MNGKDEQPASPFLFRRRMLLFFDVLMAFAAAAAITSLAMEYGFYTPPVSIVYLHIVQACVLGAFVLDRFARLLLVGDRRRFFRENWFDFFLMFVAVVVAVAVIMGLIQWRLLSTAAGYVVFTQVYILVVLIVRTIGFQFKVAGAGIHPIWVLIGSFVIVILFGAGLLMLPRATPHDNPLGFSDALFTATSATCVTGLIVRDTGTEFARFGQVVILSMIQLGGLGIMVFGTVFALLAGRGLSIRESLMAGQTFSDGTIGRIGRMVKFAVISTLLIEAVAAAVMYSMWKDFLGDKSHLNATVVFSSVFHAISAFCNAGFSLQSTSLMEMRGKWQVIGVMAPLIFLGGVGFPVLYDLVRSLWCSLFRRPEHPRGPILTLHSKMVLSMSLVLLLAGAAGLLMIETSGGSGQTFGAPMGTTYDPRPLVQKQDTMAQLPAGEQVREAVFQSVTARTAGFNTVNMNRLSTGGKLWMCLLMIIGGSPASTAGGMKTTTLAVLVMTIWCMLRRRDHVEAFKRSIPEPFVRKAVTLAGLYLTLVVTVTLLLCLTLSTRGLTFMQIFFEACSACGTVGLTCGVTESLTTAAKYVIIAAMFIGRLGPLTLLLALTVRLRAVRYTYPSEEVVLG
ncbi:MAG: potassium transporter TrkG [Planctomycetota bacterium]|nr:potassium transporter TrkG [Planctomycetota bacterium]